MLDLTGQSIVFGLLFWRLSSTTWTRPLLLLLVYFFFWDCPSSDDLTWSLGTGRTSVSLWQKHKWPSKKAQSDLCRPGKLKVLYWPLNQFESLIFTLKSILNYYLKSWPNSSKKNVLCLSWQRSEIDFSPNDLKDIVAKLKKRRRFRFKMLNDVTHIFVIMLRHFSYWYVLFSVQ